MKLLPLVFLVTCSLYLGTAFTSCTAADHIRDSSPHLHRAKKALEAKRYHDAIRNFRAHINHRLEEESRPSWENPHFYLLHIADAHLAMAQPEQSLLAVEEAEEAGVENELIVDRILKIANFYESRNRSEEALRILGKYRDRDDLLIDLYRDRLAKELVRREQN